MFYNALRIVVVAVAVTACGNAMAQEIAYVGGAGGHGCGRQISQAEAAGLWSDYCTEDCGQADSCRCRLFGRKRGGCGCGVSNACDSGCGQMTEVATCGSDACGRGCGGKLKGMFARNNGNSCDTGCDSGCGGGCGGKLRGMFSRGDDCGCDMLDATPAVVAVAAVNCVACSPVATIAVVTLDATPVVVEAAAVNSVVCSPVATIAVVSRIVSDTLPEVVAAVAAESSCGGKFKSMFSRNGGCGCGKLRCKSRRSAANCGEPCGYFNEAVGHEYGNTGMQSSVSGCMSGYGGATVAQPMPPAEGETVIQNPSPAEEAVQELQNAAENN